MDIETLQGGSGAEPVHLSRPDEPVITTATRDRFDAAAQAVRPLLVARLRRVGASREDAEDVAQEALLRAWGGRITFADDGDLLRWCTVVARRSHIDRVRRQRRLLDLGDRASGGECRELEAVELRQILATVNSALTRLTEQERASLEVLPYADRASQVRAAVARHRARSRLRLLVGPFAALGAQITRGLRRSLPAATAATALAAAVLVLGIGPGAGGGPDYREPVQPGTAQGLAPPILTPPRAHRVGTSVPAARVPVRARWSAPPSAPKPVVGIHGPASSFVDVTEHPRGSDDHLFCTNGTIIRRLCVK
jgi:RNA polymerase sigma factor (sigma-70 family)